MKNNAIYTEEPSVLLVDDKIENLIVLEKLLSGLNVKLIKASSGNAALASAVQEENLILILLDVNMPEMDGYEVLEIMHTNDDLKKIPVIFLTAYYTDENHRLKGYELGAVDYLYKPIEENILLGKVKIFMEMHKSREENIALQRRNQLILDSAGEGIFGLDAQGCINFINPAAMTMLGWDYKDLINESIEKILPKESLVAKQYVWEDTKIYKASSNGYSSREMDQAFIKKDRGNFPVDYVVTSLRDNQNKYLGAVVVFTDATHRINNEKTLQQLHQAQKMESLGQLTGGIAHDFNNILMTVQGNLELLAMKLSIEAEEMKHVQSALNGVNRGTALTKRLLAFSRKQTLFPRNIELAKHLHNAVELLSPTLGETIQLCLECADDVWPIWADANEFDNALINLAINARDAMPNGGKIYIQAQNISVDRTISIGQYKVLPGDYAKISFTDQGIGMNAETLSHVFEPFYTTKAKNKGTGLGLSMVYGFVTQSKGMITVYSELDHGTTFNLYFPKYSDEVVHKKELVNEDKDITGHETILIVEDESNVRDLVVEYLSSIGYTILVAHDATQALNIIKNNAKIDLLFTDMIMPGGINGVELAAQAKTYIKNIRVLLTSGYPKIALHDKNILEEHIMKPYRLDALASKIREILEHNVS
ncbi:response regulator [Candidatus Berkiella cookevillensis]|uniref:histidine kinase n=1 Tax=Candidatus Berkiella cookevillensis TaxID=437022 RepID=A0A0Q9YF76_9GAMM|nr:response regulator [Candidatus Berkiella cookevillensis]MCS5708830.1 response regulator [Candidatus Berkiella cookevillensis]